MEIHQDLRFQEREWRVHRIAWAVLGVLLVLGLAGLFGPGPLSHTSAGTQRLDVEYLRYAREGAPANIVIDLDASLSEAGMVEMHLSREYLDRVRVEAITPQPQEQTFAEDALGYSFPVTSERGRLKISFKMKPDAMGLVRGWVEVSDERVDFRQLIYP